ncbi:MAG: hypothetical protein QM493_02760 [Sulfurovum sp.]
MSINLDEIASSFGCSVGDVKELLGGMITESSNIIEIIETSIVSEDYDSIIMASEMIKGKINHFQLTDMDSAIDAIIASGKAEDKAGSQTHFNSLKSALEIVIGEL